MFLSNLQKIQQLSNLVQYLPEDGRFVSRNVLNKEMMFRKLVLAFKISEKLKPERYIFGASS